MAAILGTHTFNLYVAYAQLFATRSPCKKTQRGALVFDPESAEPGHYADWGGFNGQPDGRCDGSYECRRDCGKTCAHAEQRAIRAALAHLFRARAIQCRLRGFDIMHVKVYDGNVIAGGPPSCWQCARDILDVGISGVWLYELPSGDLTGHDLREVVGTWRRYSAIAFDEATRKNERIFPWHEETP